MIERFHVFGRSNHLVGISTEPAPEVSKRNAPAFILLNAGIIPRMGPFRFYVDLSRFLAKSGYTVLRMDLSGIGDSMPAQDNRPEHDRIMSDISAAMDMLEAKRGIAKFVLCGLCWGADMSHDCAARDKRVGGAVLMDTYGYPTVGFFLRDRVYPVLQVSKWKGFIKRKIFGGSLATGTQPKKKGPGIFNRQFPSKEKAVSEIQQMVSRNVKLLYIYSGGVPVYYNYGNQFRDMFKGMHFSGCVESVYFQEADHLFGQLDVRKSMFDCVLKWLETNF